MRMNWVGGARNRLQRQSDKKKQKQYFENKRNELKSGKLKLSANRSRVFGISQDLLSLRTVINAHPASKVTGLNSGKACKPSHVRIDAKQITKTENVILPASPIEKPSTLLFSSAVDFNIKKNVNTSLISKPLNRSSLKHPFACSTPAVESNKNSNNNKFRRFHANQREKLQNNYETLQNPEQNKNKASSSIPSCDLNKTQTTFASRCVDPKDLFSSHSVAKPSYLNLYSSSHHSSKIPDVYTSEVAANLSGDQRSFNTNILQPKNQSEVMNKVLQYQNKSVLDPNLLKLKDQIAFDTSILQLENQSDVMKRLQQTRENKTFKIDEEIFYHQDNVKKTLIFDHGKSSLNKRSNNMANAYADTILSENPQFIDDSGEELSSESNKSIDIRDTLDRQFNEDKEKRTILTEKNTNIDVEFQSNVMTNIYHHNTSALEDIVLESPAPHLSTCLTVDCNKSLVVERLAQSPSKLNHVQNANLLKSSLEENKENKNEKYVNYDNPKKFRNRYCSLMSTDSMLQSPDEDSGNKTEDIFDQQCYTNVTPDEKMAESDSLDKLPSSNSIEKNVKGSKIIDLAANTLSSLQRDISLVYEQHVLLKSYIMVSAEDASYRQQLSSSEE